MEVERWLPGAAGRHKWGDVGPGAQVSAMQDE